MKKEKEIKVKVVYEEGYETRFTECCLAILRRKREAQENKKKFETYKANEQLVS